MSCNPSLAKSIAHHEAGHVVVAAVLGMRLSRHGVHIDCGDLGISFYNGRKPKGCYNDPSSGTKKNTIIAAMAGFIAQRESYRECSAGCAAGDVDLVEKLLDSAEGDDPPELSSPDIRTTLRHEAERLVLEHQAAINDIAETLWAAPCTNRDHSEPDTTWSSSQTEKTLEGVRLKEILERWNIPVVIWDPPAFERRPIAE